LQIKNIQCIYTLCIDPPARLILAEHWNRFSECGRDVSKSLGPVLTAILLLIACYCSLDRPVDKPHFFIEWKKAQECFHNPFCKPGSFGVIDIHIHNGWFPVCGSGHRLTD